MYAVIRTGGKQYRVAPEDVIEIEKVDASEGDLVEFDHVLMIGKDGVEPEVGTPVIEGARVSAEVLEQGRGKKILVFKKKRRQNYRRKNGHRQHLTTVRVLEVLGAGEKGKKRAGEGAATRPKAKTKPGEGTKTQTAAPAKQKKASNEKPARSATKAKAAGFKKLTAPEGEADNLKTLPGVGQKLAEKLNEYGIFHFRQLAGMSAADVQEMDAALDLKGRAERDDWVSEARKLIDAAKS